MKYCPDCKHFIYCDTYKILHYKCCTEEDCPEFEERKRKKEGNS